MNKLSSDKKWFIITVMILVFVGIIVTMSASVSVKVNSGVDLTPKIIINAILSFSALFVIYFIMPVERFKDSKVMYFSVLSVLVLLLIPIIFGIKVNGAYRWIPLIFFKIQPAELAKIILVVYLAFVFSTMEGERPGIEDLIPIGVICGAIILFVFLEKDIGLPFVMALTVLAMLTVSKTKKSVIAVLTLLGMGLLIIAIISTPHRVSRVKDFLLRKNQDESLINLTPETQSEAVSAAVASGGFGGKGLGNGEHKFGSLSESHNDYVFSLIIEEFGLFGFMVIASLFLLFMIIGIKMALKAESSFGHYFLIGMVFITMTQTVLHMGVNVDLIPAKGFGLPFVSYGGSSLLAHMIFTGLAMTVKLEDE